MVEVIAVGIGLFGSLIGSFLNVVIYRVPAGRSIVTPASSCGNCGSPVRGFDNVPVLSWLILRGKCRNCRTPISIQYPLVEVGTALFFASVAWWHFSGASVPIGGADVAGVTAVVLVLIAYLYLAATSVALSAIDISVHRLPNALVLPGYPVLAVLLGTGAVLAGEPARLLSAGVGAVALFLFYFTLSAVYRGGMGMGDVKLSGVVGLALGWLGWGPLVVGAFAAFLLGGLFSIALLVTRKAGRRTAIPFGPWMIAGAWLGIFAGDAVSSSYLELVGLA